VLIASVNAAFSQAAHGDSSSQQNAFNNAVSTFYASVGNESRIYNGPEYYFYDPSVKGNAYFSDINAFTAGSVNYDGILYSGVQMLYDLYKDEVVVLLYNQFSKFSLINEKVKSFDFLGHHFKNIINDTVYNKSDLKSGFYDELYNGKTEVLVKRSKDIQTNISGVNGLENYFNNKKYYYLRKGSVYYSISGKGFFLDVLKDKKKELQQYIRSNGINFRQDPEDAMVKIATYYDRLTN
jgi:hypothetical protein